MVVTGEAQTKDLAVAQALRSAIEMSFGTFVSSSTEILNDELVKDEIATVSSGNVKSYQEVACSKTENGYSVTLKATVSLGNLISYAQSKGSSCEFAGQTFAMNMKLKELNKKNELEVFEHLYKQVSLIADDAFDWKIEAHDARMANAARYGAGYEIPLTIELLPNKNSAKFLNLIWKTLASLSLTESERKEYKRTNVKMYEVEICLNFGKDVECCHDDVLYFRNDLGANIYELFCMPFQNIVCSAHYSNAVKDFSCRLGKMKLYPRIELYPREDYDDGDDYDDRFVIINSDYERNWNGKWECTHYPRPDEYFKSNIIHRVTMDEMKDLTEFSINVKRSSYSFNSVPSSSSCGTVTDYDGNHYNTVKIGNQCWMKENLRTRHYSDGKAIALGVGKERSITKAYCYYPGEDASTVNFFGYLYNWSAVMHGRNASIANPSGVQGICPKGWHVPSDAEWGQLDKYVSSQSTYRCGGDGKSIAKALASKDGWIYQHGDCDGGCGVENCAIVKNQSANNATGFSAVPAGYSNGGIGGYDAFGGGAYFWSTTQVSYNSRCAYYWYMYSNVATVYHDYCGNFDKDTGCSVRCVRN